MLRYLVEIKRSPRALSEFDKKVVKDFFDADHLDLISDLMVNIGYSNYLFIHDLVASNTGCSICQEDFTARDDFIPFPGCKHSFHSVCFKGHLENNKWCPLCKRQLKESVIEELQKPSESRAAALQK